MARRSTPTFVDLFAGCGGMSLGLEQAGLRPIYVNELDEDAAETYLLNREKWPDLRRFRSRDIKELTGHERDLEALRGALMSHYAIDDIDLVVGGPPCQGYSGIGIRRTFKVERKNVPSNHLYRDMAAVIGALEPRA